RAPASPALAWSMAAAARLPPSRWQPSTLSQLGPSAAAAASGTKVARDVGVHAEAGFLLIAQPSVAKKIPSQTAPAWRVGGLFTQREGCLPRNPRRRPFPYCQPSKGVHDGFDFADYLGPAPPGSFPDLAARTQLGLRAQRRSRSVGGSSASVTVP